MKRRQPFQFMDMKSLQRYDDQERLASFVCAAYEKIPEKPFRKLFCERLINCSKTKFVEIILVLWSFFYDFCLTNSLSDPFYFSSAETG